MTFNAAEAQRAGKTVVYVTPVGAFRLTKRGVELTSVMPGIDVRRDILTTLPMRVVLPASGHPQTVPRSIVTGEGFELCPPGGRVPAVRDR